MGEEMWDKMARMSSEGSVDREGVVNAMFGHGVSAGPDSTKEIEADVGLSGWIDKIRILKPCEMIRFRSRIRP